MAHPTILSMHRAKNRSAMPVSKSTHFWSAYRIRSR